MLPRVDDERRPAIAEAWRRYLADTRGLRGIDYEQFEPWAWLRLRGELAMLGVPVGP